ncbi:MAG TPA: cysteine desulfurase-like protein [Longimicrobiales bacterium]
MSTRSAPATTAPLAIDTLPTDAIRAQFPALRREIGGRPVAYFDGPGGTQVPMRVADAMRAQMLEHNGNAGWNYHASRETDAMVADARACYAAFFNAAEPGEVLFGANMTTLTLRIAHALGRRWSAGDEIVLTELDHHANVDTWRLLERDRGVVVRVARMNPDDGTLDLDDLESKLSPRTKLLAIGAASNALGTIPDVARAARAAHDVGALVFVDAVHYASHASVDVRALGADMLAVSSYKFYGPHIGIAYVRRDLLESLDVPRVVHSPSSGPARVESGTANFEGIAGAAAAVRFLASIADGAGDTGTDMARLRAGLQASFAALHERGAALVDRLWRGLAGIRGVRLHGVAPGTGARTPTVGFSVDGVHPRDAAGRLAERALFVSHGDFYACTVIDRLGRREAGGLIRAGCAAYTTESEVDRLIEGAAELAR